MFILDTNHITALERRGAAEEPLRRRLDAVPVSEVRVTVISYEEQIRGWMAAIAGAKTTSTQVVFYARLQRQLENYCNLSVLPLSAEAGARFDELRKLHRRSSAPDLKIASIALVNNATLLTQNERDFRDIAGLRVEDWTT